MTDNCLYVHNLTKNVSEDHLKEIFMNFGNLKDIHISVDEENVSGTNGEEKFICAKIKFENEKDAKAAKEHMNGGQIDGKTVSIKYEHEGKSKGKHKHTNKKDSIKREHKERDSGEKTKRLKDDRRSSSSASRVSEYSSRRSSSTQVRRKKKSTRRR
ncbi:RNA-binding protein, putative [Plasmodium knowlesi strain H]|uniref:RNA-binding protein, putative n=3 Tax=Plasmodium knowlesi TaxID=5850 RepID=A0A5K1V081_PLAKH|nr:RNA-binding protein s1, putative [Plasmodium knowlesi strain H]OTN64818.1 putative RNA binding protein [Plasmodium knowlesi]CAA9988335.1 RNA-binding protein s1, putative [Plasmodium knowlesi strain H]SBO20127.1 RNA-binding protein, putative [Plasmodium knowlesi strain H]SBO20288.1 RNA-binding protein, putative [Plasmodium knowlesi strain H]VVS77809.1 RNA-binding protein s1, putative [Plasmodium knowlesi strain H]|eukprot:XP_002259314.1 RNA binding protein, putative [Plasmodium knowlesi strain H]